VLFEGLNSMPALRAQPRGSHFSFWSEGLAILRLCEEETEVCLLQEE
jgi:hypothetical protein